MKNTNELANEIIRGKDIKKYINENQKYLIQKDFHLILMDIIVEKDYDYKDIIKRGNLNRVYFYQLLSGKRNPSRNKVIQLVFGLKLNVEETQNLLKECGMKELYSKIKRDAIIMFAISKKMNIIDTELLLEEEDEELICN
ncbi:hypothetical protein [Vallitalea maricola]|uniref:Uncharacterized protein n=1 Tax=Vallitalea maricola TaxID=3074433 RepID=A0ACB5UEZ4_9FIRM|nr:hypothetical protein AN2V17_06560 [Vallitalea sp. AN17-2]